jgi:uncharacterized membrane protein
MEKNRIILRKIPIEMVIQLLDSLYEAGYDYFDIAGSEGDEQDIVQIFTKPEYFSEELEEEDVPKKLSDEDLNQLI